MYQNLRLVISKDSPLNHESIHHVLISDVNEKLLDNKITDEMSNFISIV
jgi:hypothetical protein